jgi:hypothetical protein
LQGRANSSLPTKLVIYSGHDTTIAMILAAMNFVNLKCLEEHYLSGTPNGDTCIWELPPFTANIIF